MYIDFITVIFLVPTLLYGWREKKSVPFLWGIALGAALLLVTRGLRPEGGVPLAYSPLRMFYHLKLFFIDCLPVLFGYPSDIFFVRHEMPHLTVYLVASYALAVLYFVACFHALKNIQKNSLVLFGVSSVAICILGFLGSSTAADVYSTRYLLPLLWFSPLILLGNESAFTKPIFKMGFISYIVAIYLMGWVTLYPNVQKGVPIRDPGGYFAEEQALFMQLKAQGIHYAKAQYWQAYRLSLLSQNDPLIVPYAEFDDRYLPYLKRVNESDRFAVIIHPNEPRLSIQSVQEDLKKKGMTTKEFTFGRFVWFEVHH
jgi:hypothetical protein